MRYRLIDAGGEVLDEGDGDATVDNGTLFVPQAALSVAPAAIAELAETEQPYGLRLRLTDGVTLELTMLGRMRGQIFADLADARTSELTRGSGIGRPEIFPGEIDGVRGELHVFEDCLVTVPAAGEAERIPFSFIDAATEPDAAIAAGYRITIAVPGRAELTASALGRQTTEFAGLLRERRLQATKRTSAFLGALLPELGPVALRWLAGILRDGRAASPAELDGVDPAVRPALLAAVTHPECAADLTGAWIGFTQVNSVRRAAVGVEPWHDSAPTPRINDHGGDDNGLGAMAGAAIMSQGFAGPFAAMGPALAYGMLGYGAAPGARSMTPRTDVRRGLLVPAHDDLTALTATGEDPAILAFALCPSPPNMVVHHVLNVPGRPPQEHQGTDIRAVNLQLARQPPGSAGAMIRR